MCHEFEGWFARKRTTQPAEQALPKKESKPAVPVTPPNTSETAPVIAEREEQPA